MQPRANRSGQRSGDVTSGSETRIVEKPPKTSDKASSSILLKIRVSKKATIKTSPMTDRRVSCHGLADRSRPSTTNPVVLASKRPNSKLKMND